MAEPFLQNEEDSTTAGVRTPPLVTPKEEEQENRASAETNNNHIFRLLRAAPRLKEVTGAVDLISHHGLAQQFETLCHKPLPASIADSSYLQKVVGSIDIRRGDGMELGQLLERPNFGSSESSQIVPLSLDLLQSAFTLRDGSAVLPESERGLPTISGGAAEQPEKEGEKKKKSKDRQKEKDREKRKDRDKEKRKDKSEQLENGDEKSRKHKKKKRKRDGEEEKTKDGEDRKHKKKKSKQTDKSSDKGIPLSNGS